MSLKLEKILEENIKRAQEEIKLDSPVFDTTPKENTSLDQARPKNLSQDKVPSSAEVFDTLLDKIRVLLLSSSSKVVDSSSRQPWNKTLQDASSDLGQASRELDKLYVQLKSFKVV